MAFKKRSPGARSSIFSERFIYRVVAVSTATFFLLILTAFLIVYHFFSDQEENASRGYILSSLEQADSTVAVMLGNLRSESETVLGSDSVASILIDGYHQDLSLLYDAEKQMKRLCRGNELADEIDLYFVKDDMVLTSRSECIPVQDLAPEQQALLCGKTGGFFCKNGQLYLSASYPEQEPMACMLVKLNESVLRRALLSETSSIYVFDSSMQPIFKSMRYPTDLQIDQVLHKDSSSFSCTDRNGNYFAAYRSDTTNLVYLCRSSLYTGQSIRLNSLRQLLPAGLLLLAGAAIYSFFLFQRICAPIQKMLDLVLRSAPAVDRGSKSINELVQSLDSSLSDLQKRGQLLSSAASSFAPQLSERLFRQILFEKLQNPEEISRQAELLQGGFPVNEPYTVFCVMPWYSESTLAQKELSQIHLIYLQELSREYFKPLCPAVSLLGSDNRLVLVVSGGDPGTPDQNPLFESFVKALEKSTSALSFQPAVGCSETAADLCRMGDLYEEAAQMLNRRLYDLNSNLVSKKMQAEALLSWRQYLRLMLDSALKGQQAEADKARGNMLIALHSLDDSANAAAEIRDVLLSRIQTVADDPALIKEAKTYQDPGQLAAYTVSVLLQNSRENQMEYLEAAQNCIADHYQDSSLSLDEVSRRVGISGPYLSSLFTNLTQEHFLDYLNHYRIERACVLLRSTDLSIAEIGYRVGFNSSSSFIRVFKKYCSMPPGTYRTKLRNR